MLMRLSGVVKYDVQVRIMGGERPLIAAGREFYPTLYVDDTMVYFTMAIYFFVYDVFLFEIVCG